MLIDLNNFTPYQSLGGGVIIGLAVSILLLFKGKVAGVSGILYQLLKPHTVQLGWRAAFILGLVISPFIWSLYAELPAIQVTASYPLLIVSGLLVGLGVSFANGCTSGHGICGMARLSKRSTIATSTFMASGFITVYFLRHVIGV